MHLTIPKFVGRKSDDRILKRLISIRNVKTFVDKFESIFFQFVTTKYNKINGVFRLIMYKFRTGPKTT